MIDPTKYYGPVPKMLDITAPEHEVEIEIKNDGKVLWVHVDGLTVLRVCKIPKLNIEDHRNETTQAQIRALLRERAAQKKSKTEVIEVTDGE